MKLRVLNIRDVAEYQLCTGCGACASVAPGEYRMVDDVEHGRRPLPIGRGTSPEASAAMSVCPGVSLRHTFDRTDPALDRSLMRTWGPVIEVWEGFAADGQVRFAGSSGGAATALSLFALQHAGFHGVLHSRASEQSPIFNRSVLSTTREDLLRGSGSRYAPASPCDALHLVEAAPGPCVFVGKPCDAAAVQRTRELRPALDRNLGLVIAFFCAGAPSTRGTLELMRKAGVDDPSSITSLRYRGNGWPGRWTVRFVGKDGAEHERSMSYEESWGFLQRYRQWRCYICPDHSGEFADIAVGDPWYRPVQEGEPGKSLIVARTKRGVEFLHAAAKAGAIILETKDPSLLPRSQPNLVVGRGANFGRLLGLRLRGAPTPRYEGFSGLPEWWSALSLKAKLQSTIGTMRRVARKQLRVRKPVRELVPSPFSQEPRPASELAHTKGTA